MYFGPEVHDVIDLMAPYEEGIIPILKIDKKIEVQQSGVICVSHVSTQPLSA